MRRDGEQQGVLARLAAMDMAELDALDFGVIELDEQGIVLQYNAGEVRFSGMAADEVKGRHFFGNIAPCTNNSLVASRFHAGVRDGRLDERIQYTFTVRMRPTNVILHLYRDAATATNWVLVYPYHPDDIDLEDG